MYFTGLSIKTIKLNSFDVQNIICIFDSSKVNKRSWVNSKNLLLMKILYGRMDKFFKIRKKLISTHYCFTDKFLYCVEFEWMQTNSILAKAHKTQTRSILPKTHEIYEYVQVCMYMLIPSNALFLLAPNYPLLSSI